MFAIQEAKINANAKELCKENTRRAYEPKQKEFLEYCRHKFRNDDNSDLITFEKVFGFMIYQCYRTKKDKNGYQVLVLELLISMKSLEGLV